MAVYADSDDFEGGDGSKAHNPPRDATSAFTREGQTLAHFEKTLKAIQTIIQTIRARHGYALFLNAYYYNVTKAEVFLLFYRISNSGIFETNALDI